MSTRSLLTMAFLGQLGCSPAATVAQLKDPCSELSFATVVAGCKARIETECTAGDASCPVYAECTKARETWQACK